MLEFILYMFELLSLFRVLSSSHGVFQQDDKINISQLVKRVTTLQENNKLNTEYFVILDHYLNTKLVLIENSAVNSLFFGSVSRTKSLSLKLCVLVWRKKRGSGKQRASFTCKKFRGWHEKELYIIYNSIIRKSMLDVDFLRELNNAYY